MENQEGQIPKCPRNRNVAEDYERELISEFLIFAPFALIVAHVIACGLSNCF